MSDAKRPRQPQVFDADDAVLAPEASGQEAPAINDDGLEAPGDGAPQSVAVPARKLGWGSVLLGALGSLGILAAGVMRLRAPQSTPISADVGESSLDCLAHQSGYAAVLKGGSA